MKMERLSEAYFRYRDLLREQQERASRIEKIFGVLGVHSPDVSTNLANNIKQALGVAAANQINSAEVRSRMKLWEILQLFLSAIDSKGTISDFKSFLIALDIKEGREFISTQAINSAIRTHPELFEEIPEDRREFVRLKAA